MPDNLIINDTVTVPGSELSFAASRASGPGGQHVNTSDTRIQVRWNLESSTALTIAQKNRLRRALGTRLTIDGDLLLFCDTHRSQRRNREDVTQRLVALIRENIVPPKRRKKTKPTQASKERRLEEKKRRAKVKKRRGGQDDY